MASGRRIVGLFGVVGLALLLWSLGDPRPVQSPPSAARAVPAGLEPASSTAPQSHVVLAPLLKADIQPGVDREPRYLFVTGADVALREAPSKSAPILDRLARGAKVEELKPGKEWVRVRHLISAQEGWVSSRFLQ